jgi:hypothetical protein
VKNVLAVIGTIIIVGLCAYGIYKQVDDFNKKNEEKGISYVEKSETTIF